MEMDINEYTQWSDRTAIYPKEEELHYIALGLAGEAGEVANIVKKVIRDDGKILTSEKREKLIDELGDVFWYLARFSQALGISASEMLQRNHDKLESRLERNKIQGSGDKR
jgi:NTP pyrophosphatase (non-canonical NTP hydrolase)